MFSLRLLQFGVISGALAFTHYTTYDLGKSVVKKDWNAEKISLFKHSQESEHENRKIESRRAQNVSDSLQASSARARALQGDAGAARVELERLRSDNAAARLQLPSSTSAACVTAADTTSQLLDYCAAALADVAAKADGHANDSLTIQQAWPR